MHAICFGFGSKCFSLGLTKWARDLGRELLAFSFAAGEQQVWVLGVELRSLCLSSENFTSWAIPSAPTFFLRQVMSLLLQSIRSAWKSTAEEQGSHRVGLHGRDLLVCGVRGTNGTQSWFWQKGKLKTTMITIPYPTETCQDDSGIQNTTKNKNKTKQTQLSLMFHYFGQR